MATTVKQNGTAKKENATVRKEVQEKLTKEATGKFQLQLKQLNLQNLKSLQ